MSLVIEDSAVDVTSHVVYLTINEGASQVNVELQNSSFTSPSHVVQISGASRMPLSYINIAVSNSHFAASPQTVYVTACSSHITFDVHNSTFEQTRNRVIYIQTASINASVNDNMFVDNQASLYLTFCDASTDLASMQLPHQVTISSNRFSSHPTRSGHELYFYSWGSQQLNHNVVISDNHFLHSLYRYKQGVYIRNNYRFHSYSITSNRFINMGGEAFTAYGTYLDLSIRDNLLQNSLCHDRCLDIQGTPTIGQTNITGNTFIGNYPEYSVISFRQSGSSDLTAYVTRNEFQNNTATLLTTDAPHLAIHENFFESIDNYYNVRVTTTYNTYVNDVINASLNFWGTSDVNSIARSIYDKDYDEQLATVNFRPYLRSKSYCDIQNKDGSFVSPSSELGGAVNGNVTLTAEGGPYVVIGNIKVQPEDVLTLTQGVVLNFKSNVGLLANGKLLKK